MLMTAILPRLVAVDREGLLAVWTYLRVDRGRTLDDIILMEPPIGSPALLRAETALPPFAWLLDRVTAEGAGDLLLHPLKDPLFLPPSEG